MTSLHCARGRLIAARVAVAATFAAAGGVAIAADPPADRLAHAVIVVHGMMKSSSGAT